MASLVSIRDGIYQGVHKSTCCIKDLQNRKRKVVCHHILGIVEIVSMNIIREVDKCHMWQKTSTHFYINMFCSHSPKSLYKVHGKHPGIKYSKKGKV